MQRFRCEKKSLLCFKTKTVNRKRKRKTMQRLRCEKKKSLLYFKSKNKKEQNKRKLRNKRNNVLLCF